MALYRNPGDSSFTDIEGGLAKPKCLGSIEVMPAKMDEMLLEALNALEHTKTLHESTPNPEIKRQTKRILENLHASLAKLAPLGIHSVSRLERVPTST